jgi:hypothetical protein
MMNGREQNLFAERRCFYTLFHFTYSKIMLEGARNALKKATIVQRGIGWILLVTE